MAVTSGYGGVSAVGSIRLAGLVSAPADGLALAGDGARVAVTSGYGDEGIFRGLGLSGCGGGAEGGQGGVVEGEEAANGVVVAPAEAGQHGLAIGGLGHVHRFLSEAVMLEAPLRHLGRRVGQALRRGSGLQSGQRVVVQS